MTTFEGDEVKVYVAKVLARGLEMYAKTKIRPNRSWTPMAMLAEATKITGVKYRRGEYLRAAREIRERLEE